jgi:non-specific serine/threonine protein kinase
VDKDNAPFIAQICYRLDGIPLAIELAAARIRMLSIEQISARLDDRFRLLTGGARTALPRQQTLRALIDWSYDLLSENERLLLRRLSVFAGGWTLEAAEQVCSAAGIEVYDVLDLLSQLVNKSLVIVIEQSQSSDTRYRMLETIRQYAREKLLEAGDIEIIRQHHLAYFVKLAEQAEPELYRSDQVRWLNRLDDELDNLRMALEWTFAGDVESGLRIAVIPWRFWQARGYLVEIGEWLAQALERYGSVNSLHVQALAIYSLYFFRRGNFPEAVRLAAQSLQMARSLSNQQLEAFSLSFLGVFTILQGSSEAGTTLLEQSVAIYRALGEKIGLANALEWLSISKGTMQGAIDYSRESLQLYRELGNLTGITNSLTNLARLTLWMGDFSSPAAWLEEALSISRQLGDQASEDEILATFGILAYWQADYGRARAYYEESLILCEKVGDQFQSLWAHVFMAYAVLRQGDIHQAHEMFADGIRSAQKAGLTIALVFAVEGLASLNINQGNYQLSIRLFAWADAMREKIGDFRPPVEQASVDKDLAVIRSKVDDAEFTRLSAQGRSMTVEQAIALALEEIQP